MTRPRTLGAAAMLILLAVGACSALATDLVLFYEEGCIHCARVEETLAELQVEFPELNIEEYEIHAEGTMDLLGSLLAVYGAEIGSVPILFIANTAMVSSTFYEPGAEPVTMSELGAGLRLRQVVEAAIAQQATSPWGKLPEEPTQLVVYRQPEAQYAEALATLLLDLKASLPLLDVRILVTGDDEDESLYKGLTRQYDVDRGGIALFLGETAVVDGIWHDRSGAERAFDWSPDARAEFVAMAEAEVEAGTGSPLDRLETLGRVTLWAVIAAAALDSINPCDFAVLILLLGTLLVIGRKGKVLLSGIAFSAGIYIAYFVLGFVVYSILGMTLGTRAFREPFILAVSSIAILVGLWQMKDLFWYGRFLSIEVPERWKPAVKKITSSAVTIPGAFVAGIIDSLFLAPCTSGPYLAILSLLSQTTSRLQGIGLLLIYNLVFILPLLAITVFVHLGFTTTARAEKWRTARMGKLHFISGVVMVLIGVAMIIGVEVGYI